ncbi:MAG: hypothetical protein JKY54_02175 [Flavobacteriales bacterium]|nr:hypothetical protein [Flavobacteriales bacterium]
MKKELSWVIAILLFVITFQANAQAPGYVGKRLLVDYSFATVPTFLPGVTNSTVSFATIHNAEVSWVLNRRISIAGHYTVSFPKLDFSDMDDEYFYDYYLGDNRQLSEVPTKYQFIGFDVQIYGGKRVAPVGTYFNLGFSVGHFTLLESFTLNYDYNYNYTGTYPYESVFNPRKYGVGRLRFGINNKKIIGGSVYLISGINANILVGKGTVRKDEVFNDDNGFLKLDRLWMTRKVRFDNLLHIKLGIGILFV